MKVRYFEKRGAIWLDFRDHTGKRHRVPSGCATRAEAERVAPLLVSGAITKASEPFSLPNNPTSSRIASAGSMSFRGAFNKGLREREKWIQSKDKKTLEATFEAVAAYWGEDKPVSKATREATLKWRAAMLKSPGKRPGSTLSPSTINHRLSMLTTLLEMADQPPHTVKHLSTEGNGRSRRITPKEIAAMQDWLLANAVRHSGALDMIDLITMGLETGARQGEILGLRWTDLTEDSVTFRKTKNYQTRIIPLQAGAKAVLEARKAIPGGPFSNLKQDRAGDLWDLAKAGLGLADDDQFVFHGLRHECISRLADRNVTAPLIQAIAGHRNITTTQKYVHASQQAMRSAFGMEG